MRRHQRQGEPLGVRAAQWGEGGGLELSVDPDERYVANLQMKVACAALNRETQQIVDVHPSSNSPADRRDQTRTFQSPIGCSGVEPEPPEGGPTEPDDRRPRLRP